MPGNILAYIQPTTHSGLPQLNPPKILAIATLLGALGALLLVLTRSKANKSAKARQDDTPLRLIGLACLAAWAMMVIWVWQHHPVWVICYLTTAVGGTVAALVWWWRSSKLDRQLIHPLFCAAAPIIGVNSLESHRKWVKVPKDLTDDDATIRINLPADFHGGDRVKSLQTLVNERIPGSWTGSLRMDSWPFYVEFRRPPAPPKLVPFSEVEAEFRLGPDSSPVLGLDVNRKVVRGELDDEAAHWLLSIKTRGGKSALIRALITYWVPRGVDIIVLDPKRISQKAFQDVPGVTIHTSEPAFVQALSDFRQEMDGRYQQLERLAHGQIPPVFRRKILIIEEMNSLTGQIRTWWNRTRTNQDPQKPPALDDLSYILFQGGAAHMHVVAVLQHGNARAVGGPDLREQFGMMVLGQWSVNVWKMLVGTTPVPLPSKRRGRFMVLTAGERTEVQSPWVTEEEARAFATTPLSHTVRGVGTSVDMAKEPVTVTTVTDKPTLTLIHQDPPTFTLREAAESIVPESYDALRQAKARDRTFPTGKLQDGRMKWTEAQLREWSDNRPGKAKAREQMPS